MPCAVPCLVSLPCRKCRVAGHLRVPLSVPCAVPCAVPSLHLQRARKPASAASGRARKPASAASGAGGQVAKTRVGCGGAGRENGRRRGAWGRWRARLAVAAGRARVQAHWRSARWRQLLRSFPSLRSAGSLRSARSPWRPWLRLRARRFRSLSPPPCSPLGARGSAPPPFRAAKRSRPGGGAAPLRAVASPCVVVARSAPACVLALPRRQPSLAPLRSPASLRSGQSLRPPRRHRPAAKEPAPPMPPALTDVINC